MMPPALPGLLLALSSALLIRAAPPAPAAPRGQTLARCPAPTGPPATLGDAARRRLEREKPRIAEFFNRYKAEDDDEESYACVSGWGDADEARQYVAAAASHVARARR